MQATQTPSELTYHILDTETASLQGPPVEVAFLRVDKDLNIIEEFCTYVNPERLIDPHAMAVHNITDEMVIDAPTMDELAKSFPDPIRLVAHNAPFDRRMIKSHIAVEGALCTLALSRLHITGTTNHKLEVLQKELNLPLQKSHSALGDVHTVRDLLVVLRDLTQMNLEDMYLRAQVPKLVHKMPFGKHKGKVLTSLPVDYRDWLLSQEIDNDLRTSLERLKGI